MISEKCCKNIKLKNDNGKYVRTHCGQVDRYETVNEFVNFYDNRHKIIRKSVYYRSITFKIWYIQRYNIQISASDKDKILETFEKIESVLPRINSDHTRMININFILKQIFRITKLQYKNLPISK